MPISSSVKFFRHTDPDAPQLTGAAGKMADILNACLVSGYNVTSVDSITRVDALVTVTIDAGHNFEKNIVIEISGADQSEYNGHHRVTAVTSTTLEYELENTETPATPATGTIECKIAPAGWERSFVSVDNYRMAFKSISAEATGFYLYIDDSNVINRVAQVKGYESMVDIDTGTNPFPYNNDDTNYYYWHKSNDDSTNRNWALIADDSLFYFFFNKDSGTDRPAVTIFGDIISYLPSDPYSCVIAGHSKSDDDKYGTMAFSFPFNFSAGAEIIISGFDIARNYLATAPGKLIGVYDGHKSTYGGNYGSRTCSDVLGGSGVFYPSPITGAAHIIKPSGISEVCAGQNLLRGTHPGLYAPLHYRPWDSYDYELVQGSGDLDGKIFMSLPIVNGAFRMTSGENLDHDGVYYGYPHRGQILVDIIGPWR